MPDPQEQQIQEDSQVQGQRTQPEVSSIPEFNLELLDLRAPQPQREIQREILGFHCYHLLLRHNGLA